MKKLLIFLLTFYKKHISPTLASVFGEACRFTPSCSQYTLEAVKRYGAGRGLALGVKRLARCHPWGGMGYDPI